MTDVTFAYPEAKAPTLKRVSMEVGRGETVALVGENGAGKTTLAKLLCRSLLPLPDRSRTRLRVGGVRTVRADPP